MKLQLIRNATLKITYANQTILADPMLSVKGAFDPFAGNARNPTVELPIAVEHILAGLGCVMVSHPHPDHFDIVAQESLPKGLPVFCQPGDESMLTTAGFQQVTPIENAHTWQGITLTRTGGQHGMGPVLERMGQVSGFIFQASGEPTIYWVGDTIWCDAVEIAIANFKPDIIITNSGGAKVPGYDSLILMDEAQTLTTVKASDTATVVAVHLEALDHCAVTRQSLRQAADEAGIAPTRLIIPSDGEILSF